MLHTGKLFSVFYSLLALGTLLLASVPIAANPTDAAPGPRRTTGENSLGNILKYISSSWDTLTRSMTRCQSLEDAKTEGPSVLYLPAGMAVPPAVDALTT